MVYNINVKISVLVLPFHEIFSFLNQTCVLSMVRKNKNIISLFLLGKMTLNGSLSEDTTAGRLILTHCTSLLLKGENSQNDLKKATNSQNGQKGIAYLSAIEDSGKSILYLRLSSSIVQDFGLKDGDDFGVEVQFQLNRLPLCEMHLAIDKLPDMNLIYPDMARQVQIPWTPGKHWSEDMNSR